MIETPYPAPNFKLMDDDGNSVGLQDYKGKWLALYFYPKDDTPGCTIEACSFRDVIDDLTDQGVEVLGVSKDSQDSHQKFKAKHNLNFKLLSDPDGETIQAYGAWGKKMFGREGILRKTFLIDPNGQVQKVYGRVTPAGHGQQIVDKVKELKAWP